MTSILNKTNHPVEIKKIYIEIWALRDEIEATVRKRIKDSDETDPSKVDIEDIKEYYTRVLQVTGDNNEEGEESGEGLDASGNPMDDDAQAMMAALGGEAGGEDNTDEAKEEQPPAEGEEDADAQAMAAEMLGDQGATPEDDAAAELAAQMLADQGGSDPTSGNSEKLIELERIRPEADKIFRGFVLLSDIQMDQILMFTRQDFIRGQNIVINFVIPNSFNISAEVVNTLHISRNSKIISNSKPSHRIQCKFLFKFPDERASLRHFLQSIEPDIPKNTKKSKPKKEGDEDDVNFDDLGF